MLLFSKRVVIISRYCQFVRLAKGDDGTLPCYITGNVWAAMHSKVVYKVDLVINKDGVVQQAQCECGAGEAPSAHCKHVGTVLYGLLKFISTGDLITALTCTQVSFLGMFSFI